MPRARTGGCSRKCRAGLVEKRVGEVEGLATWMSGGWRLSRGNSDTECPVWGPCGWRTRSWGEIWGARDLRTSWAPGYWVWSLGQRVGLQIQVWESRAFLWHQHQTCGWGHMARETRGRTEGWDGLVWTKRSRRSWNVTWQKEGPWNLQTGVVPWGWARTSVERSSSCMVSSRAAAQLLPWLPWRAVFPSRVWSGQLPGAARVCPEMVWGRRPARAAGAERNLQGAERVSEWFSSPRRRKSQVKTVPKSGPVSSLLPPVPGPSRDGLWVWCRWRCGRLLKTLRGDCQYLRTPRLLPRKRLILLSPCLHLKRGFGEIETYISIWATSLIAKYF